MKVAELQVKAPPEEETFAAAVERGRAQIAAGQSVDGARVAAWVASWVAFWGTDNELPRPKPLKKA